MKNLNVGDTFTQVINKKINGGLKEVNITINWTVCLNTTYNTHQDGNLVWCKTDYNGLYLPLFAQQRWFHINEVVVN